MGDGKYMEREVRGLGLGRWKEYGCKIRKMVIGTERMTGWKIMVQEI